MDTSRNHFQYSFNALLNKIVLTNSVMESRDGSKGRMLPDQAPVDGCLVLWWSSHSSKGRILYTSNQP